MKVTLEMPIEDLVASYPEAAGFLTRNGVRCIRCGEPVWGTLGELLESEGIESPQRLVRDLNDYLRKNISS